MTIIKRSGTSNITVTGGTKLTAGYLTEWLKEVPVQATITVSVDPGDRPFDTTTTRITANW